MGLPNPMLFISILCATLVANTHAEEDGLLFDNETFLQEQLARREELLRQVSSTAEVSSCNRQNPMPICYQECPLWCWAATSSMLIGHHRGGNSCIECDVVTREMNGNCCPSSCGSCNRMGS